MQKKGKLNTLLVMRFAAYILLALCVWVPGGCATPTPESPPLLASVTRFEFTALRMGVKARIVVYGRDEEEARAGAAAGFERIAELEAIMSDYRPDSELSRLTEAGAGRDVNVSADLWAVLRRAKAYSEASGGAFDVTVGALSALWRRARAEGRLPSSEELEEAKSRSGHQLLVLDESERTVRLLARGVRLDLGGIAKGYAVQEALAVLQRRGLSSALVALAGDVAVGAPPPGEEGWRIRVETGLAPPVEVVLRDAVVSTSGASQQYLEVGGVHYAHIIDPRTGLGSTRRSAAVIVSCDGMQADALGTCLFLMGIEEGAAMLRGFPGARAWIQEEDAGEVRDYRSEGFPEPRLSDGR